jgi:hypothetical protein
MRLTVDCETEETEARHSPEETKILVGKESWLIKARLKKPKETVV